MSPGSTEGSNLLNPKRPTPRHIIIKMAKFKGKENLKDNKGETASNIQGSPLSNQLISQ